MWFYAHDHLYSPVAFVSYLMLPYERYEYDAYGEPTIYTDKGNDGIWLTADDVIGTSSAQDNFYLFTGRRVDILDNGSLKIQYNTNPYYDYYTGRWLSHDPLGYVDRTNLYEYARSNPLKLVDSFGLACEYLHKKNCVINHKDVYLWDESDGFKIFSRIELAYSLVSFLAKFSGGMPIGTLATANKVHLLRATPVWTESYRFHHYECQEHHGWTIYRASYPFYRRVGKKLTVKAEHYWPLSTGAMPIPSAFYDKVKKDIIKKALARIPPNGLDGHCVDDNEENTDRDWTWELE
ncbi:MAG: RHS repeat-associated core domain-containing protein [Planctomycetota bacterium]